MGNERLRVFPPWEIIFDHMPEDSVKIATSKVKWDEDYQKKHKNQMEEIGHLESTKRLTKISVDALYRALSLNGYARFDFRLS